MLLYMLFYSIPFYSVPVCSMMRDFSYVLFYVCYSTICCIMICFYLSYIIYDIFLVFSILALYSIPFCSIASYVVPRYCTVLQCLVVCCSAVLLLPGLVLYYVYVWHYNAWLSFLHCLISHRMAWYGTVLYSRRLQYPLTKEYTAKHSRIPNLIKVYSLIKGYWSLWVIQSGVSAAQA